MRAGRGASAGFEAYQKETADADVAEMVDDDTPERDAAGTHLAPRHSTQPWHLASRARHCPLLSPNI